MLSVASHATGNRRRPQLWKSRAPRCEERASSSVDGRLDAIASIGCMSVARRRCASRRGGFDFALAREALTSDWLRTKSINTRRSPFFCLIAPSLSAACKAMPLRHCILLYCLRKMKARRGVAMCCGARPSPAATSCQGETRCDFVLTQFRVEPRLAS